MSPRQFGKVDTSTGWPPCGSCPHSHMPGSACPPTGVWLVLHFCPACNATTQLYCRTHRDRHAPQQAPIPAPPQDVRGLAAGEREEG